MKKGLAVTAAVMAGIIGLAGCSKEGATGKSGAKSNKVVAWSFTDELQTMLKNYYEVDNPGKYDIEFSLTPTDQFQNKLDPVLASGSGCPDVFALEDAFVKKYIDSGLLLDITDVYNEVKDKVYAYPAEIGTCQKDGKVYGMSWQVTPGALFYRRSLAKKYLGTDDPAEVQKYLANMDKFLETAELLKSKSSGKCLILSSIEDMFKPYGASRKDPWVVDGKIVVDPQMEKYMETAKILRDKGYEGRVQQWSEGWYAGMKDTLSDEAGNMKEVFCYLLPTWGLHYVLKTNAPETSGDWAMCKGPMSYRWGGTWVGAYKNTKNPEAAKEIIKYLATDDGFLTKWAKDTGDVVSNKNVVNAIKDTYSDAYLGGQNHYAEFAAMAGSVNGKITQGTDQDVENLFMEETRAYVNGEKSKDQAIADFKQGIAAQLSLGM